MLGQKYWYSEYRRVVEKTTGNSFRILRNPSTSRPHGVIGVCFPGNFPSLRRSERERTRVKSVTAAISVFDRSGPPTTKKVGNRYHRGEEKDKPTRLPEQHVIHDASASGVAETSGTRCSAGLCCDTKPPQRHGRIFRLLRQRVRNGAATPLAE